MADVHIKSEDITILLPEVEQKVNTEISVIRIKANVTEELINNLREQYGTLTIDGQKDKQGYLTLQTARKAIKTVRVAAEKEFDKGREEAVAVAQKWLDNKKVVVADLKSIEEPLYKLEKEWEEERDRLKELERAKIEQQGIARMSEMIRFGAALQGPYWVLGGVQYEAVLVKESADDIYADIKADFQAEFEVKEAARIKQQEDDAAAALLLKQQQDEIAEQQKQLKEGQEALRLQQQALADKEIEQKAAAKKVLTAKRQDDLLGMGIVFDMMKNEFFGHGVTYSLNHFTEYLEKTAEEWDTVVALLKVDVDRGKAAEKLAKEEADKKLEDKRLKDIEDAKILATGKSRRTMLATVKGEFDGTDSDLGALVDDQWTIAYEAAKTAFDKEEKRIADEAEKERVAKLGDKAAWEECTAALRAIKIPQFKSGQYRALGNIAKEKLENIVSLQIAK